MGRLHSMPLGRWMIRIYLVPKSTNFELHVAIVMFRFMACVRKIRLILLGMDRESI